MSYIQKLQQQLSLADDIIQAVEEMQRVQPRDIVEFEIDGLDAEDKARIKDRVAGWFRSTQIIIDTFSGKEDTNAREFRSRSTKPIRNRDYKSEIKNKINSGKRTIANIIQTEELKSELGTTPEPAKSKEKTPKIFISHKQEDKAYADALVSLIEFIIGSAGDNIFCSSIPGYGIKLSRDIIDELKAQFRDYDIFTVIIHSPRYYKSIVCLNEMGASWILGTKFGSFMTKDCTYDHLHGVIGREKICINLNDEAEMLNAHLNDFKNALISFFDAAPIDENKWENARSRFVKEVSALKYEPEPDAKEDLFTTLYLPAFDTIFSLLDIEHFSNWGYECAIDGNTILRKYIYDNLGRTVCYIKSRSKHKECANWDSLLKNLGLLLSDFQRVFSSYATKLGDEAYCVERFYKTKNLGLHNPDYEVDLNAYTEHVRLVSDLLFEFVRLCNLILSRIREIMPGYKQELGILYLDNNISEPDLVYREDEISDSPYPGIKQYIKDRLTREKHYGGSASIDIDGYGATLHNE